MDRLGQTASTTRTSLSPQPPRRWSPCGFCSGGGHAEPHWYKKKTLRLTDLDAVRPWENRRPTGTQGIPNPQHSPSIVALPHIPDRLYGQNNYSILTGHTRRTGGKPPDPMSNTTTSTPTGHRTGQRPLLEEHVDKITRIIRQARDTQNRRSNSTTLTPSPRPRTRDKKQLSIGYCNVQRCGAYTDTTLNTCRDHEIVFIGEPCNYQPPGSSLVWTPL